MATRRGKGPEPVCETDAVRDAKRVVELFRKADALVNGIKEFPEWTVKYLKDGNRFDHNHMINYLEEEDIEAINKYIMGKFKGRLRKYREELKGHGTI